MNVSASKIDRFQYCFLNTLILPFHTIGSCVGSRTYNLCQCPVDEMQANTIIGSIPIWQESLCDHLMIGTSAIDFSIVMRTIASLVKIPGS
jgi:hypothetical protein